MSVWVCSEKKIMDRKPTTTNCRCGYLRLDGRCDSDNTQIIECDAVEYAPKHDLDAAINERDLLQERCDELRKKIALMEEKG